MTLYKHQFHYLPGSTHNAFLLSELCQAGLPLNLKTKPFYLGSFIEQIERKNQLECKFFFVCCKNREMEYVCPKIYNFLLLGKFSHTVDFLQKQILISTESATRWLILSEVINSQVGELLFRSSHSKTSYLLLGLNPTGKINQ